MRRPSHERERDHRRDHRERERDNSWDSNRRQRPPMQERTDEGREREVQRANPVNPANPGGGPRGPPPQPPRTGQEASWRQTPAFGAINRQPGYIRQSISASSPIRYFDIPLN